MDAPLGNRTLVSTSAPVSKQYVPVQHFSLSFGKEGSKEKPLSAPVDSLG
jgi:hypothetical protein